MTTRTTLSRRQFGAGVAALGAASTLPMPALAQSKTIKIGFVTPQTGPLAVFAESDAFVLEQFRTQLAGGLQINGETYNVEFIVKDSQSSSNRAATVAQELMFDDEVHLITATSTPDTTNPVADQAELNEVPCLTNDTPWQPHFFGRQGDPAKGFDWTFHFFWGLEDVISTFTGIWNQTETNKVVGALWPNDPDGNAWGSPDVGFPPVLEAQGYTLVDPGRYQVMSDDFSAQISAFKAAGVEILTGVVPPPDFATFWLQAAQQGFEPKVVTFGKALEFPQVIGSLGDRGEGLSTEVWWSPGHPYSSGFTGQSSAELAAAYEAATGNPWTMPLAFKHSLFEVAIDALKRSADPMDPASIRDALRATDYQSVVGPVNFMTGPVPNISKTPLVGGQWHIEGGKPVLEIVENGDHPAIAKTADVTLIGG
ncbi:ABC transporter substrate-binding protein [Phaeobacter inhibens]|jgi:branched-chain amino acid transport system substrate-binding protein|uniref:Amino acid/amide ABC transporter substrate-binding protein, HAAT family n=1 Tax=Phaeobacter inhibens TaxID=221822 RepID=A0A2I7KG84_9RHOB|nr:ABC transporter substrate-binding protein [Phaeobacter inhibens]AUR01610.1 amino acid/amide ABC transporter substrate-binding protein, HAAT family [Phaeobacter inhibens]